MKSLVLLVALASTASAEPIADVVRAQLLPQLPPGTDVAEVHLPRALAKLDVAPNDVSIELPRALAIGRPSIKLSVKRGRAQFVPVTIGKVVEVAVAQRAIAAGETISPGDIVVELRAAEGAAKGSLVGAVAKTAIEPGVVRAADVTLPPPLARGTQITVEMRRGAVRVRGAGTLELAARIGDAATVRFNQTRTIVRGTLVSSSVVVVGESP
jgi:flagella basal body P-ring formation protein FlgA